MPLMYYILTRCLRDLECGFLDDIAGGRRYEVGGRWERVILYDF
jgi:hypothetical protein